MASRLRLAPPVFAALSIFVGVSMLVSTGVTLAWDETVLRWVGVVRSAAVTDAMLLITFLGDGVVEVPFALGVAALLWVRSARRSALALVLGGVTGELAYLAAKAAFRRPRPDLIERLSGAGWHSYPSGHAMLAPVLWSLALLLLARTMPAARRWPFVLLATVLPIAIATSRVYLGVHYPSDVVGALALGVAWMLLWLDWSSTAPTSSSASIR